MLQITIFDTKIEYFLPRKNLPIWDPISLSVNQISLFESKKISHVCAPLASPPVPYPTLPYPSGPSRGRNVYFPTSLGYLNPSLLYPPLPYRPNTPLPYTTHLLHTFPLLCPRIPSTPLISPALIPCPSIPSSLLPYHLLPSPFFSHLPLYPPLLYPTLPSPLILLCSKDSEKVKRPSCFGTRMYRGRNCLVLNVFWGTEMTLSLKGPGNV